MSGLPLLISVFSVFHAFPMHFFRSPARFLGVYLAFLSPVPLLPAVASCPVLVRSASGVRHAETQVIHTLDRARNSAYNILEMKAYD